jgi:hypothetical protein
LRGLGAAMHAFAAFGGLGLCVACGGMLPTSQETAKSPWNSFEEAKVAYDSIVPSQTTAKELQDIGYDPFGAENVRVLSYLDVVARFMPQGTLTLEDLDPDLRACLAAREACWAIEVAPKVIDKRREGALVVDMLGFRRETITTGWQFSAVVVLEDDIVRYKIWDGAPSIEETTVTKKPLGPLQEMDEAIAPRQLLVP